MGRWRPIRVGAAALALGLALGAGPALGDDVGPTEDALPSDDAHLTGKDIYSRVAENRFRSYIQKIALFSSDRGGSEQETRLTITWENFREKEDSDPGVLSKTVVRYTHPFEVRFTGYLMLNNLDRANDQFVYLASRRRDHDHRRTLISSTGIHDRLEHPADDSRRKMLVPRGELSMLPLLSDLRQERSHHFLDQGRSWKRNGCAHERGLEVPGVHAVYGGQAGCQVRF